jgi:ATP-dependent Clp protease adaptor protein ClpS
VAPEALADRPGAAIAESRPVTEPVLEEEPGAAVRVEPPWVTILWNCDCHTFEQVARQLVKAIRCSYDEGMAIAWRVHNDGKAVVRAGPRDECERVARILGEIGLRVTVAEG